MQRLDDELARLDGEMEEIKISMQEDDQDVEKKESDILEIQKTIQAAEDTALHQNEQMKEYLAKGRDEQLPQGLL